MTKLLIFLLLNPFLLISVELMDKIDLNDGHHFSDVNRKDSTILVQDTLGNISIYDMNTFDLVSTFPAKKYDNIFHFEELSKVYGHSKEGGILGYIDILDYKSGETLDSLNLFDFLYKTTYLKIYTGSDLAEINLFYENDFLYFGFEHLIHYSYSSNLYFRYMKLKYDLDTLSGHYKNYTNSIFIKRETEFHTLSKNIFISEYKNEVSFFDSSLYNYKTFSNIDDFYFVGNRDYEVVLITDNGDMVYNTNNNTLEKYSLRKSEGFISKYKFFIKSNYAKETNTTAIEIVNGNDNVIELIEESEKILEIMYNEYDNSLVVFSNDYIHKYNIDKFDNELFADFYSEKIIHRLGDSVQFINNSFGENLTYKWEFDTGDISEENSPKYLYNKIGIYNVKLTINNGDKVDSVIQQYRVINDDPMVPNFSYDKTTGKIPFDVHFTDQSEGEIYYWKWDFGDGNTSIERNPTHRFTQSKDHKITLKVSNGISDSIIFINHIVRAYPPELTTIEYDFEHQRRIIDYSEKLLTPEEEANSVTLNYQIKYEVDFNYLDDKLYMMTSNNVDIYSDSIKSLFYVNINKINTKNGENQLKRIEMDGIYSYPNTKIINSTYFYTNQKAYEFEDFSNYKDFTAPYSKYNKGNITYITTYSSQKSPFKLVSYDEKLNIVDSLNYNWEDGVSKYSVPSIYVNDKVHILFHRNDRLRYEVYSKNFNELLQSKDLDYGIIFHDFIVSNEELIIRNDSTLFKKTENEWKMYSKPGFYMRGLIKINNKIIIYGSIDGKSGFVKVDRDFNYIDELILNDSEGFIANVKLNYANELEIAGLINNKNYTADEYFVLTKDKWFELPNSVDEGLESRDKIKVSPNPFSGITKLQFESGTVGKAELIISDLNGKMIAKMSINIKKGENIIELDSEDIGMVKGIYFVKIRGAGLDLDCRVMRE